MEMSDLKKELKYLYQPNIEHSKKSYVGLMDYYGWGGC